MVNVILIVVGVILIMIWGIAHLFATKGVIRDFGDLSKDNKNILMMEWIIEGFALIFIGLLVLIVTAIDAGTSTASQWVYLFCSIFLFSLAVLSLFTGARAKFFVFKLCPVIFTVSGVLLLLGIYF